MLAMHADCSSTSKRRPNSDDGTHFSFRSSPSITPSHSHDLLQDLNFQDTGFFSAEISEISPKTSFTGDHRYFLIPNEIFRYSKNMSKFKKFDQFWTNLELCDKSRPVFTGILAGIFGIFKNRISRYLPVFFPKREKNPCQR
jgi:hypothetical protein